MPLRVNSIFTRAHTRSLTVAHMGLGVTTVNCFLDGSSARPGASSCNDLLIMLNDEWANQGCVRSLAMNYSFIPSAAYDIDSEVFIRRREQKEMLSRSVLFLFALLICPFVFDRNQRRNKAAHKKVIDFCSTCARAHARGN